MRTNFIKSTKDIVVEDVFFKLTVKELFTKPDKRGNNRRWAIVECECGNRKECRLSSLANSTAISCGCAKKDRIAKLNALGKHEGISIAHLNGTKRVAASKGWDFDLTPEYVWELWENQGRKCALTGMELTWRDKFHHQGTTASIDRIDSTKGYVQGNIQIVHKDINMMKRRYSQDYFIELCKKVSAFSAQSSPKGAEG